MLGGVQGCCIAQGSCSTNGFILSLGTGSPFKLAPGLGRHKPQPLPENKPGWINCEEPGDKHLIHQLSWKSRRDNSRCQSHCSKGISLRHTGAGKDEPGGQGDPGGDGNDRAQWGGLFAVWPWETSQCGAHLNGGNLSAWCFGPLPVGKDSTASARSFKDKLRLCVWK